VRNRAKGIVILDEPGDHPEIPVAKPRDALSRQECIGLAMSLSLLEVLQAAVDNWKDWNAARDLANGQGSLVA
jgi:hypothetical protein